MNKIYIDCCWKRKKMFPTIKNALELWKPWTSTEKRNKAIFPNEICLLLFRMKFDRQKQIHNGGKVNWIVSEMVFEVKFNNICICFEHLNSFFIDDWMLVDWKQKQSFTISKRVWNNSCRESRKVNFKSKFVT